MRFLIASLLLLASGVLPAATATTNSNAALYDKPGGQVSATLLAHTLLEVGERQGGWYAVQASGGRQGWLRAGAIRFADRKQNETVFSGLWGWLNSSRAGANTSGTTTVGIRGLDAGDIEQATPNHQAVDALESLRVTEQGARQFAAQLPLQSQPVKAISKEK